MKLRIKKIKNYFVDFTSLLGLKKELTTFLNKGMTILKVGLSQQLKTTQLLINGIMFYESIGLI